jgi:hypothetical protein
MKYAADDGVLLFSVLLQKKMVVFFRSKEATSGGVNLSCKVIIEEGHPR